MNRRVLSTMGGAVVAGMLALLLVPEAPPVEAQAPIVVRMATLVPDGSSWHQVLKETAAQWKSLSGGRVVVRLFPGGVAGDDPDVVRKMRLRSLNAAVLTSVGVAEVDRAVYALSIPMAYDSYEEVYAVLEGLRPRLEASLESKGFVVLNWADGGWVHFFSQTPVAAPDDLRRQKLFTWAGDPEAVEIWRAAGCNPVPLPSTELATALQTGLVTTVGAPPQVSVITQYFLHAKNLTRLRWQILLGATLISKETWEKIPADLRPALLEATRDAGRRLQADIKATEERDIKEMQKRGLNVVAVDAKTRVLWQQMAESAYPRIRGKMIPAETFDEALRLRDEYRKQTKKGRS